jgi:transposase
MSRVELYERIRKDNREGLSIRALAVKHHVHRRTVREALGSATPPARKTPEREAPALGPWMMIIRAWLVADRDVPRKQRHTARRIWQRLVAEYGAVLAESTVRAYVAQVNFELDNVGFSVTVPQTHRPGEEAECDFGEFMAWIEGVLVKCWMFCLRLSHSGRGFHVAFCHQAQEAFFEGHVLAFEHFGGVPAGLIRYDNLKAAVIKVLLGRERLENQRFVALRSHYGFDSFYCLPGIDGSHEKGCVAYCTSWVGCGGQVLGRFLVPGGRPTARRGIWTGIW